jgi:DNA-binding response OmpR family regulator
LTLRKAWADTDNIHARRDQLTDLAFRILLIDDDIDGCEMVRQFLCHYNQSYIVTWVSNSHEAMQAIAGECFDLYIIDYWLPDIDGMEICTEIRRSDRTTPIIIYSGVASDIDIKHGLDAGADAYLSKPTGINLLGATIEKLLASDRSAAHGA